MERRECCRVYFQTAFSNSSLARCLSRWSLRCCLPCDHITCSQEAKQRLQLLKDHAYLLIWSLALGEGQQRWQLCCVKGDTEAGEVKELVPGLTDRKSQTWEPKAETFTPVVKSKLPSLSWSTERPPTTPSLPLTA